MKNGHYFHTCEKCGANLDPGETCDCITDNSTSTVTQLSQKCDNNIKAEQVEDMRNG